MTDKFENKIAEFVKQQKLLEAGQRILLAVSGGADSIALFSAVINLKQAGVLDVEFGIGHVNHGLRGEYSDADEKFVAQLGQEHGIQTHLRSIATAQYARANKVSIETAGRTLRRQALIDIALAEGYDSIATAHHADDNVETILHRLLRGTGFRGLGGICPERDFITDAGTVKFIRPMLCVTRRQVIEYCQRHDFHWRHDHTNDDLAYTRNRIRHALRPELEKNGIELTEGLAELSRRCRILYKGICAEAEKVWGNILVQCTADEVELDLRGFVELHEMTGVEVIRRALVGIGSGERDLTEKHYKEIMRRAKEGTAVTIDMPGGFAVRVELEKITFFAKAQKKSDTFFEIETCLLDAANCDIEEFKAQKDEFVEWFDFDRVTGDVKVRNRQPGDRFWPFGLGSEKKVGKFLTAAKLSRGLRENVAIVCDNEKIIWVAPVRVSELTRVTDQTKKVLQVTLKRPEIG